MFILCIDQARSGAWSIYNYGEKELVKYGAFDFDREHYTFAEATHAVKNIIANIIKTEDISAVFIEDIQMRHNVDAFRKLASLQGVLIDYCVENELLYELIAPTKWQSFCRARGRTAKEIKADKAILKGKVIKTEDNNKKESKMLSINYVKEKFNINTENDNISDSICLGWYVVNNVNIVD